MTLPSASSPNEPPLPHGGERDAVAGENSPPAGAVSLAELIADSGPLPADAALECVQRIAERLTHAPRASCTSLEPGDVLVDDDGGVWIRDSPHSAGVDLERDAQRFHDMNRLGKLLAFVATGDGSHLTDGAKVDPATLPPPLSQVAIRLFSRNGACYRSYADVAREVARLRIVGSEANFEREASATVASDGDHADAGEAVPVVEAGGPRREIGAPEEVVTAAANEEPPERNPRFAIAMALVVVLGAVVAFVLWQLLS